MGVIVEHIFTSIDDKIPTELRAFVNGKKIKILISDEEDNYNNADINLDKETAIEFAKYLLELADELE